MKVGTVCYSHSRGLGHLAKSFIDAKVIDDIHVIRHPNIPMKDWYPGTPLSSIRDVRVDSDWLKSHSAMLFFETPFDWDIIRRCKVYGVKTYLVTMYECTPETIPAMPDVLLCPSLLDYEEFRQYHKLSSVRLCSIPVEYPWSLRSNAVHFVHNGGYLGMRGREGTELLIESMTFVKSPIKLTIRVQENVSKQHQLLAAKDKRIEYLPESVAYDKLYEEGDVAIFPQKFNGMSMPLLEARASGMLVMTTDRFPTNKWLGDEGALIPVSGKQTVRLSPRFRAIQESLIDPKDIAKTIDSWYGLKIETHSRAGLDWALNNNWTALRQQWKETLSC